jgi:hypothetical protein
LYSGLEHIPEDDEIMKEEDNEDQDMSDFD